MQIALEEINTVLGVTGSFVCASDGTIPAQAMPPSFDTAQLSLAARIASQTLNALETSRQRVTEVDLSFGQSRLLLKNLRGGAIVILCSSSINLPLLNLTANVAAKRIAAALKPSKPKSQPGEAPKKPTGEIRAASAPPNEFENATPLSPPPAAGTERVVPAEPSAPTVRTPAPPPVPQPASASPPLDALKGDAVPTLYAELEQEMYRLIFAAQRAGVVLRVLDPMAIWLCCPRTNRLLTRPEKKHLAFAGRSNQIAAASHMFGQAGFQPNRRLDAFYGGRRLHFAHPLRELTVEIYLDSFDMYLHLDLGSVLDQVDVYAPETFMCLLRLQLVEMPETGLRDLCALFLEHDLITGPAPDKININQIVDLCADDWGWYRAATMNLDRVTAHAPKALAPAEQTTVVERVRMLRQRIEDAPKSLRWQMRARVGDAVRWYETPMAPTSPSRPDMAFG